MDLCHCYMKLHTAWTLFFWNVRFIIYQLPQLQILPDLSAMYGCCQKFFQFWIIFFFFPSIHLWGNYQSVKTSYTDYDQSFDRAKVLTLPSPARPVIMSDKLWSSKLDIHSHIINIKKKNSTQFLFFPVWHDPNATWPAWNPQCEPADVAYHQICIDLVPECSLTKLAYFVGYHQTLLPPERRISICEM